MTGAQQISSRMRAVFVSAGWLSRTEVVKTSPTRGYMGIPSFGTGDRLWDVDLLWIWGWGPLHTGIQVDTSPPSYQFPVLFLPLLSLKHATRGSAEASI